MGLKIVFDLRSFCHASDSPYTSGGIARGRRYLAPDVSPARITRQVRLASAQARAAWFVHQLAHGELHPFQGRCERCGTLTSSWCEGCYARCGLSPLTFSSLCQVCDVERRACRLCEEVQIDYNLGHEAYRCQQQQGATDTLEVEIKGGQ